MDAREQSQLVRTASPSPPATSVGASGYGNESRTGRQAVGRVTPAPDVLLATVADCEARRLELLAELKANGERHAEAVRQLVIAVGAPEAGRLLGVSRQQVWRLAQPR